MSGLGQGDASKRVRLLVGESVWEEATLTIHYGDHRADLFIEFDAEDVDSIVIPLNVRRDLEELWAGIK